MSIAEQSQSAGDIVNDTPPFDVDDNVKPLWPRGVKIPIIGLCGEFQSGKTLNALLIDPEHTLCFDLEKSSECYESGLPFKRIDVIDLMNSQNLQGYKPVDLFRWFCQAIDAIDPGKYRVIVLDPVSEIEAGLAEWVRDNPKEFGYTAQQFANSKGMYWGCVKDHWKYVLSRIASKCECFVFTAHMRQKWAGNQPTRQREAKGKETLPELATLYLEMQRPLDDAGKRPKLPSANVLKDRLALAVHDEETGEFDMVPILPPRLEVATAARIRQYIENPPDYAKLKEAERVIVEHMSDEERLLLETQRAEAERDRAAMELETAKLGAERAAGRQAVERGSIIVDLPAGVDPLSPAGLEAAAAQPRTVAPSGNGGTTEPGPPLADSSTPASSEQISVLIGLAGALGMSDDEWSGVLNRRGVESVEKLNGQQAEELRAAMTKMHQQQEKQGR